MLPGLLRAVAYNAERRQGDVRLFEVGSVFFRAPKAGTGTEGPAHHEPERLSAVFAHGGDDAWAVVAAWRTMADALGIAGWEQGDAAVAGPAGGVLHPHRSASIVGEGQAVLGVLGEVDPAVVGAFGLVGADGRPRRIGWLDLDIGVLLDRRRVPRRSEEARPVSRYPSSDVDLAFVVPDEVPAGSVEQALRAGAGDLLESVELFDVYRGPSVATGARSLAFRLRFCALDHTLGDEELAALRSGSIAAVPWPLR
jgi:phenylalanyl-tRNA synthetase beta chain